MLVPECAGLCLLEGDVRLVERGRTFLAFGLELAFSEVVEGRWNLLGMADSIVVELGALGEPESNAWFLKPDGLVDR